MFVSRARFEQMRRLRQAAEEKVERQTATIHRLQSQIDHQQDEHPDSPVAVQPATGDARTVQRLELSERARAALDERVLELHRVNMLLEHELCQVREQLAALQAAAEQQREAA